MIDLAVMVVLDFLAGVPVTVRQSPTARELTASVTVWENVVVPVQFTVVWPVVFCTSIEVPEIDATLPLAEPPGGGVVAAPAPPALPTVLTRAAKPSAIAPCRIPRPRLPAALPMTLFIAMLFSFIALR